MFQPLLWTKTVLHALRGAQLLVHALFGVKILLGTLFAPPLKKPGYGTHKVHTRRNPLLAHMEIGEFGVGRPDFGGRWPRGEALGKKKVAG